jgi:vanillate/4-hydroxybenzoate decarboxylase subunit D
MACPRCRSSQTELMACSPVAGAWEFHLCQTCFFGWRTSEPESIVNPDRYDPRFRLTREQIAGFAEVPAVPAAARAKTGQAPRK